ncbi:MAG: DUF11 domain-containing protein [Gammaproteobacteria bacterium]|nr:DUF11 domain-containing protein [Gammaproteobacteria bacterium]
MKTLMSVILITFAAVAVAQEQGHLDVQTTVQKEEVTINEAGESQKRLVTADVVVPGETVFYTITFMNVSAEPADNVVITNPIAEDLMYVDGSAFGPGMDIQFSVDGGATFAAANELTVVEDGEVRDAIAADFTHVRWVMQNDLDVGAQGTARFAAILE